MVFKFATFDPAQDPDDYNPAFPPPQSPSPSVTLCQPCEITRTLTRALGSRLVAAGASLVFTATAFAIEGREIQDESAESAETQFYCISSDVPPEFHQRQLKEFTLKELKAATQKFSNKKVIGRGGFGKVYEGRMADGSPVAIKRLKEERTALDIEEFEAEVMIGSIVPPHRNLLPLLGICRAKKRKELLLVYPLMINKSAAWCLREPPETQPPMDWPTRRKIAAGVARGLSHLHDLNIVHRDIKAANIMLNEDSEPHIGDFGLAKFIDRRWGYSVDCTAKAPTVPRKESDEGPHSKYSGVTTAVRGTIGHVAPEYLSMGKCSLQVDVFGFGMVLLELVTGLRVYELTTLANEDDLMLFDWVKGHMQHGRIEILADVDMEGKLDLAVIEEMVKLALLCTQLNPAKRPNMAEVVRIIEGHSIDKRWEEYCHREERRMQVVTINQSENVSTSLFDPKDNPDLELPLM